MEISCDEDSSVEEKEGQLDAAQCERLQDEVDVDKLTTF